METTQKCYSSGTGTYQKEFEQLFGELVPMHGNASTVKGELVRCINKLLYEYHNNGNCNAYTCTYDRESCWECDGVGYNDDGEDCFCCDGSGETESNFEGKIDSFYADMLSYIRKNVPQSTSLVEGVENIIKTNYHNLSDKFSDENEAKYNALADKVMEYVITL